MDREVLRSAVRKFNNRVVRVTVRTKKIWSEDSEAHESATAVSNGRMFLNSEKELAPPHIGVDIIMKINGAK